MGHRIFVLGGAGNMGVELTRALLKFPDVEQVAIGEGKLADLIVLDRDILTVPVEEIKDTQVLMTIKHGRIVFSHLD